MKFRVVFALVFGCSAFRYEYPKEATDGKNSSVVQSGSPGHATGAAEPEKFHFDDTEETTVTLEEEIETDVVGQNYTIALKKRKKAPPRNVKPLETKKPPRMDPTKDYSSYNGDEKKKRRKAAKASGKTPTHTHELIKKAVQAVVCPKKKELNLVFENGVFFGIFLACLAFAVIRIIKECSAVTTTLLVGGGFFFLFAWYEEEKILGETLFIEEKILGWC